MTADWPNWGEDVITKLYTATDTGFDSAFDAFVASSATDGDISVNHTPTSREDLKTAIGQDIDPTSTVTFSDAVTVPQASISSPFYTNGADFLRGYVL
ncbi:hypothetical protein EVG20_g6125 [Dentipellis fragilis]|uniref:Uncharacterized protein n=1 Tax=Dentipellis fragilis TaxID=205917 RepID=A0A4Y9YQB4_9AGAM|nr:hypothetical protein EVG20_g6125 [Dentipellis fragilis]